ncbi:MAG TPA: hypothetical protein VN869_05300 [Steroidobacteraceae bacterium]|nr:hypothetical protein [Steroidobacteraceae bacterium]
MVLAREPDCDANGKHESQVCEDRIAATRAAWSTLFEHYVFGPEGAVTDHIPPDRHGVLARLAPADAERLRAFLAGRLQKKS